MKLDSHLRQHTKINSKWIEDLNIRPETVKLLEENTGKKLFDTGLGNSFLDMISKVQDTKAKIDKWNYITLTNFCTAKEINKMRKEVTEREKTHANNILGKGLMHGCVLGRFSHVQLFVTLWTVAC